MRPGSKGTEDAQGRHPSRSAFFTGVRLGGHEGHFDGGFRKAECRHGLLHVRMVADRLPEDLFDVGLARDKIVVKIGVQSSRDP